MTLPLRTLIVVPCFNEATRLDTHAFIDFAIKQPQIHFLFVNDGSSDTTRSIIESMSKKCPENIHTLSLEKNQGKAEAVRQGFLKGFEMNAAFIGFLDADLASPLETILELESAMAINAKDIVMAARVQLLGRNISRQALRHYIGRIFATAASIILNLPVYDTQCGAKLFRVNSRLKSVFAAPFTVKWIFDVEILARFLVSERTGASKVLNICMEYPIREWIDKKGSKLRTTDFLTSGMDLIKIFFLMQQKSLPKTKQQHPR